MRKSVVTALILGAMVGGTVTPALAQTAPGTPPAAAPAEVTPPVVAAPPAVAVPADTTTLGGVTIVAPEGYTLSEFTSVTADELKGLDLYDAEGNDIAEISDLEIATDQAVSRMIVDVGGFLGMGVHTVALSPDQIQIYRNADGDLRGYVTLSKEALEALPEYVPAGG